MLSLCLNANRICSKATRGMLDTIRNLNALMLSPSSSERTLLPSNLMLFKLKFKETKRDTNKMPIILHILLLLRSPQILVTSPHPIVQPRLLHQNPSTHQTQIHYHLPILQVLVHPPSLIPCCLVVWGQLLHRR